MSLRDRPGYELTEIEKELLFRRENAGYVVWVDRKNKIARLSPSPFLKPEDNVFYVFLTEDVPAEGELVEVKVEKETKKTVIKREGNVYRAEYVVRKDVVEWKRLNPFKLLKRVTLEDLGIDLSGLDEEIVKKLKRTEYWEGRLYSLVDADIARDIILHSFRDVDDNTADTILIYLLSSPNTGYVEKGGINAAALVGSKSVWNALAKIFSVIPPEFKRPDSMFFYKYGQSPGGLVLDEIRAREVCLEFVNPEHIHIHVPQPLLDAKVKAHALPKVGEDLFLLRVFMLQGLLLTPRIKEGAEKAIKEGVTFVRDSVVRSGTELPFRIDMTFVTRVSLSMGRLAMKEEIDKRTIETTLENWLDAYEVALKAELKPITPRDYYRLTKYERIVYNAILDLGGLDRAVSSEEIASEIAKKGHSDVFNEYVFEQALRGLLLKGYVFEPRAGKYMAVEMRD